MDKSWMLEDRRSRAYELGVEEFLKFAVENARNENKIPCPCWDCGNTKDFGVGIIKDHLFYYGVTTSYQNWIWNGEPSKSALNLGPSAGSAHDSEPGSTHEGEAMFDSESVHMEGNTFGNFEIHPNEFTDFFENADQPLYPGCKNFTNLSALVKCFNLKAKFGMSDTCFFEMLIMSGEMIPEGHGIPSSMYQAKKALCALGMEYEKIHACSNDCILFRNVAIGIYNWQRSKQVRKNSVWKIMMGALKQPTNKECGYHVMRFMRDLINDDIERQLAKWEKMNETTYKQEEIDEVRNEWA